MNKEGLCPIEETLSLLERGYSQRDQSIPQILKHFLPALRRLVILYTVGVQDTRYVSHGVNILVVLTRVQTDMGVYPIQSCV